VNKLKELVHIFDQNVWLIEPHPFMGHLEGLRGQSGRQLIPRCNIHSSINKGVEAPEALNGVVSRQEDAFDLGVSAHISPA
jgi:hypothetical protein